MVWSTSFLAGSARCSGLIVGISCVLGSLFLQGDWAPCVGSGVSNHDVGAGVLGLQARRRFWVLSADRSRR